MQNNSYPRGTRRASCRPYGPGPRPRRLSTPAETLTVRLGTVKHIGSILAAVLADLAGKDISR